MENVSGPIIVCGTQRSGTTLMGKILNSHPNGFITHELDFKHILNSINGALFHPRHKSRKVLSFKGDYEKIISNLYQDSTSKNLEFYGDKLPEYIIENETLLRFFPEAKFIFCSREPYEVISSMKKRNQDSQVGIDRGWTILPLEDMCKRWKDSHASAEILSETSPKSIKIIKYEELKKNTKRMIQDLAEFIGVQNHFDGSLVKENNPQMFLNNQEKEYIREKTYEISKRFGYQI